MQTQDNKHLDNSAFLMLDSDVDYIARKEARRSQLIENKRKIEEELAALNEELSGCASGSFGDGRQAQRMKIIIREFAKLRYSIDARAGRSIEDIESRLRSLSSEHERVTGIPLIRSSWESVVYQYPRFRHSSEDRKKQSMGGLVPRLNMCAVARLKWLRERIESASQNIDQYEPDFVRVKRESVIEECTRDIARIERGELSLEEMLDTLPALNNQIEALRAEQGAAGKRKQGKLSAELARLEADRNYILLFK